MPICRYHCKINFGGRTSFPEWRTTPHVIPDDDLEAIGCRRRVDGDEKILDDDDEKASEDAGTPGCAEDHEFALEDDKTSDALGDDGREQWFPGDDTEAGNRVDDYITELETSRENAGELTSMHYSFSSA